MSSRTYWVGFAAILLVAAFSVRELGGQAQVSKTTYPIATQWMLSAATPPQKNAVKAVFMIVCERSNAKGTAFLIEGGPMVTNNHVVAGCQAHDLWALSPTGERVHFSKLVTDANRDIALLRPAQALAGGLELGHNTDLGLGARVSAWGYPLSYQGPAALLTVGYIAGYSRGGDENHPVKRLIVNGAFNPGNSGGPLMTDQGDRVVGIVVAKWTLYSSQADLVISTLTRPGQGGVFTGGFQTRAADGTMRDVSDNEAIAHILKEYYDKTQVMIGEAISVEELRSYLEEKQRELSEP